MDPALRSSIYRRSRVSVNTLPATREHSQFGGKSDSEVVCYLERHFRLSAVFRKSEALHRDKPPSLSDTGPSDAARRWVISREWVVRSLAHGKHGKTVRFAATHRKTLGPSSFTLDGRKWPGEVANSSKNMKNGTGM